MLKGFRDFILRGNVVDLAVAVILGAAFNAIVTSFVKDVLTQFIAAIVASRISAAWWCKVNGTPDPDRQLSQCRHLVSDRGQRGLFWHCAAVERVAGAGSKSPRL